MCINAVLFQGPHPCILIGVTHNSESIKSAIVVLLLLGWNEHVVDDPDLYHVHIFCDINHVFALAFCAKHRVNYFDYS